MNTYEATLVIQPGLEEEQTKGVVEEVTGLIEKGGGKVTKSELSTKQPLAYKLRRNREGYYLQLGFLCPPKALRDVERRFRINQNILRHLIVREK